MKKSEIYGIILEKACDICEVSRKHILDSNCRIQAVVAARCIAFHFMKKTGLANDDIAYFALRECGEMPYMPAIINRSRCYDALVKTYDDRYEQAFTFREMCKEMHNFVREITA